LRERGIFVPAIRYPTVARGKARLRVTVTAAHTADDVQELAARLRGKES
jgi:7-keto-8-aminopelargonate synthetase-like enzyme